MKVAVHRRARKSPLVSRKKRKKRGKRIGLRKGQMLVPQPEQEKILAMWVNGAKSIIEISRETGRDWDTVAKIVKSESAQRYLAELREKHRAQAMELAGPALKNLTKYIGRSHATKDSAKLSLDFLTKAGILDEMPKIMPMAVPVQAMTTGQLEAANAEEVKGMISAFAEMAVAVHKVFELPMPEMEDVKVGKKVKKEVVIEV
jgi:hypothetical protein